MRKLKAIIKSMRIHSYIKNAFVGAPLIFTNKLDELDIVLTVLSGVVLFCLVSSGVYIINDIKDIELDRKHPVKRNRAIASGELPIRLAVIVSIIMCVLSIIGSYYLNKKFLAYIIIYLLIQISYSMGLKRVAVVESLVVAVGFVLRVMAGGILVDEPASEWIILATFFLALVLVLGKRRCEYMKIENGAIDKGRSVLMHYTAMWLDLSMSIAICSAVITYSLYCISARGIFVGGKEMIYTLLPVILGLLRYLQLVSSGKMDEDIGQLLFKDIILFISVSSWIIMLIIFIYIK